MNFDFSSICVYILVSKNIFFSIVYLLSVSIYNKLFDFRRYPDYFSYEKLV